MQFGLKEAVAAVYDDTKSAANSITELASMSQGLPSLKATDQPHVETLPAEVWSRILEYSVFSDILRVASECSFIQDNALPLLKFLYFDRNVKCTEDLVVKLACFHFHSVEEIVLDNVFYNVTSAETFDMTRYSSHIGYLVQVLGSFTSLEHVFLGKGENETKDCILQRLWLGASGSGRYTYAVPASMVTFHPCSPRGIDTSETYESLLRELSSGYRSQSLPEEMTIHGLPSRHDIRGGFSRQCRSNECSLCRYVCSSFPLIQLVSLKRSVQGYFPQNIGSVSLDTRLEWISKRQGGKEVLVERQTDLFLQLFSHYCIESFEDEQGMVHDTLTFDTSVLNAMEKLKGCGCDPSRICLRDVVPFRRQHKIKRRTFSSLFELGFQVTEDDFVSIIAGTGIRR